MNKIWIIALREYRAMVATKAFLVSLILMPVLMFGGLVAVQFVEKLNKSEELKIAVWDPEGKILTQLQQAAEVRNQFVKDSFSEEKEEIDPEKIEEVVEKKESGPIADKDLFIIEPIDKTALNDEDRIELSEKIKNKELHAFVEIPSGIADLSKVPAAGSTADATEVPEVKFYSSGGGIQPSRRWLTAIIAEYVKQHRMKKLDVDIQKVQIASIPVSIKSLGLVEKTADGEISAKESKGIMESMFVPMGMMMFMMMVIFLAGQPMLESVLEEKSQRIAEVLLGSCNPTQLMAGKLLGTVAGSMTIFLFYTLVSYIVAARNDYLSVIPFDILPWFFAFQLLGVLFYSSIYMSIGSAVSQLKEAQSLMMPVIMCLMIPMVTWFIMVQKPDGQLAFWMSIIPPTAPMVMVLRLATGVTVPIWQKLLSLFLLSIGTGLIVYLAGRIFRVGILWQGKTPKLTDLFGWAIGKAS